MVGLTAAIEPIAVGDLPSATAAGTSFGWMLLWMFLVLVLVVGGMLLLSRFLRRFPGIGQRRGDAILVEETLGIDAKASVHIIAVDGKRLLVGSTDGAISTLATLEPKGSPAKASEDPA